MIHVCSHPLSNDYCSTLRLATLVDALSGLLAPYSTSSDSHDRVIQYAPRYRLAFTLLNEDAAAGQAVHRWDIQDAIARELHRPLNEMFCIWTHSSKDNLSANLRRLSVLHNFTIESQVQFHAPLAFMPTSITVNDTDAYGLTPEDLTVFVNSAEWTLCEHSDSFVSYIYII
jgi:GPI-anchor transamidase subunit S